MKKSEVIIRTLNLEDVRFRFKQLSRDLFIDRFVQAVRIEQTDNYQGYPQMVYINQHIGSEYSFPHISFRDRKSC
jgi:hypothetical protein